MSRRILAVVVAVALAAAIASLLLLRRHHPPGAAPQVMTAAAGKHGEGRVRGGDGADAPQRELNLLVDDDRAGTLRLEGQVIDAEEQPVGGALVTVSTNPPRETRSLADGSFAFNRLVGRSYTLVARADAGTAGPVTARLTAKSDPVTLRLHAAAAVEVTVLDAERKPIAGATVEVRDVETLDATTGTDGKALVKNVLAGGWDLVAWAPGYAKTYGSVRVPADAKAAPLAQELVLKRGAPVAGRVLGPDGAPVAGALVTYAGVASWTQRADPRLDAKKTDDQGAFRFEAMPAGSFRFSARDDAHAPGATPPITLDGQTERGGVEIKLDVGGSIAGKVVDKAGAGAAAAEVRVAVKARGFSFAPTRQVLTDEQGHFEIKGLPRREADVIAVAERASSEAVTIDLTTVAEKKDVVIALAQDGTIAGVVVDKRGQPVAESSVGASPDFRGGGPDGARFNRRLRGPVQDLTDASGHFELHGLAEGAYVLNAARPGAAARPGGRRRDGVTARTGETSVRIELPSTGGVKGKVLFADGHAPDLFTVSAGMGGTTPFASGDGTFELLDELLPGAAMLTVDGPTFDRAQAPSVQVVVDQVVDVGTITVAQSRVIRGRVLASGTPVPGATVYAGQRLFGTGSDATSQNARGGFAIPGADNTRTSTTDENGMFALYGVGYTELAIMAQHDTLGRSQALDVPPGTESSTIDLTILPFAALEGSVTKGGKPMEGVPVTCASQTVPAATFNVATGADGQFRFDQLAPDAYRVSAVIGRPLQGGSMHSQVVTLAAGQTGQVSITVVQGTGSLQVTPIAADGSAPVALIRYFSQPIAARTYAELLRVAGASGPGIDATSIAVRGQPRKFEDLVAATYTVCAVPFPKELRGIPQYTAYIGTEADALPVFCVQQAVTEGATASVDVPVKVPTFVPPPGGLPLPGGPGRGGGPPD